MMIYATRPARKSGDYPDKNLESLIKTNKAPYLYYAGALFFYVAVCIAF
jgi:hypothetical protein